jgi:hypothetical protein
MATFTLDILSCDALHCNVHDTPAPAYKYITFDFAAGKKEHFVITDSRFCYGVNPVLSYCTVDCQYLLYHFARVLYPISVPSSTVGGRDASCSFRTVDILLSTNLCIYHI